MKTLKYTNKAMFFSVQAQMFLSEFQIFQKLTLPYLANLCFSIAHFQVTVAYNSNAYKKACTPVCSE